MRVTNNGSETPVAPTVAAARRFGAARRHRAAQGGNNRSFAREGPTAGLIVALCAVVASGILADPGAGTPATTVPSTNDHEETPTAATAQVLSATVPTLAPAPLPVASVVDVRQEPDAPAFGWAGPAVVAAISRQGTAVAPPVGQPSSGLALAAPDAPSTTGLAAVLRQTPGLLPANRILTYYGHPHDPNMGILGEYPKEELLGLLQEEAANYEAADPSRPVIPAFEVIATVAQAEPTQGGQYLLDTDTETLVEYADFAEANGILLFLDLQIGRNTVAAEIEKVRPLLERPHVHLALDPEFAVAPGQVPGTHIGELTADQIGTAQEMLAGIVRDGSLPPKILVVHQFREDMIVGKERLAPEPGVQLVIESDGFGSPELKSEVYDILIRDQPVEYAGVKLFYKQDVPLMSPGEIVSLEPSPHLVIYQ